MNSAPFHFVRSANCLQGVPSLMGGRLKPFSGGERIEQMAPGFVAFTKSMGELQVHAVIEPELQGLVACNGQGCVLCRAGYELMGCQLLPIYDPTAKRVKILMFRWIKISASLAAQLDAAMVPFRGESRWAKCIIFDLGEDSFRVFSAPLIEDHDKVLAAVEEFNQRIRAGQFKIETVVPHLTNEQLLLIPGLREKLDFGRKAA